MTSASLALLAEFETAAAAAKEAEAALHKRMAQEIARVERERTFAYRRLNLMRGVTEAAARAESEEIAVAGGLAVVRAELGWDTDSEARVETLSRFASVTRAIFAGLAESETEAPPGEVARALADFEAWYAATFDRPFWVLFEQYVEEMPLVER